MSGGECVERVAKVSNRELGILAAIVLVLVCILGTSFVSIIDDVRGVPVWHKYANEWYYCDIDNTRLDCVQQVDLWYPGVTIQLSPDKSPEVYSLRDISENGFQTVEECQSAAIGFGRDFAKRIYEAAGANLK